MAESINIREAFEAWYRRDRRDFEEYMLAWFEDHYVNTVTQAAWCAWCAAISFLDSKGAINGTVSESPTQEHGR